jgi:hypothetical protein
MGRSNADMEKLAKAEDELGNWDEEDDDEEGGLGTSSEPGGGSTEGEGGDAKAKGKLVRTKSGKTKVVEGAEGEGGTEAASLKENYAKVEWDGCCDVIEGALEESLTHDLKLNDKTDIPVKPSVSNGVALFNLVLDAYSMSAVALSDDIPWQMSEQAEAVTQYPIMNFEAPFELIFLVACLAGGGYLILALSALPRARNGTLGKAADGHPAKLYTWPGLQSKLLSTFGGSLYFPIMLNLIKVFVCDYTGTYPSAYEELLNRTTYLDDPVGFLAATTAVPAYLVEAPNTRCWEGTHYLYCAGALIVLLTYYPMASLLFPNLQFVDESLDIKFEPSFLIIIAQGKLLLAGIMAVFTNTPLVKVSCLSLLPLSLACLLLRSCFALASLFCLSCPWRSSPTRRSSRSEAAVTT